MTYILNHVTLFSSEPRYVIMTVIAALLLAALIVYAKTTLKKLNTAKQALEAASTAVEAAVDTVSKKKSSKNKK